MKKVSICDLRYDFKKVERLLHRGEEIQITRHRRVIARLVADRTDHVAKLPDFLGRPRKIYGRKILAVSGVDLVAADRNGR